ncbi:hypothetical protein [Microbulbifer variabilis]|uniref:hypothetical protein n=1 Tax=Microbulbifer variabilis TaxID=266805 RepID=UPI001CFCBFC0|nr:hypothetical protein [Microbulbifer variabilis]
MSYARYPVIKVCSVFSGSLPDLYFDGVAYASDSIVLGMEGLDDFLSNKPEYSLDQLREGRFWLVYKVGHTFRICTDDCGQDVLFYYHVGDVWAFSNSFLALVEHLTLHGVSLHLDPGAAASFFLPGAFGETLISQNTAVQQVKVLSRSCQIRISAGKFAIEKRYSALSPLASSHRDMPDLDVLTRHIDRWKSRLKALVENSGGRDFSIDISGGSDSRLLLALLLNSSANVSGVHFVSNAALEDDYRVAGLLAKKYGFSLASGVSTAAYGERLSALEQFELYIYGCLGVYHKVYFPRFRNRPGSLRLHGGGGELMREYYPGEFISFIDRYKKFFQDQSVFSLVKSNYRSCLDVFGYSSANDHYLDFRCRFHFGRSWYKSNESNLISPLISSDLIREFASLSSAARSKRYLHLAYYLLVDPEMLSVPFDETAKSFSDEDVKSMLLYISKWQSKSPKIPGEVDIFIGGSREPVSYPWDKGGANVDDIFQVELEKAKNSNFIDKYFSTVAPGFVTSSNMEEDARKRYGKLSHLILFSKLESMGVNMVL